MKILIKDLFHSSFSRAMKKLTAKGKTEQMFSKKLPKCSRRDREEVVALFGYFRVVSTEYNFTIVLVHYSRLLLQVIINFIHP